MYKMLSRSKTHPGRGKVRLARWMPRSSEKFCRDVDFEFDLELR